MFPFPEILPRQAQALQSALNRLLQAAQAAQAALNHLLQAVQAAQVHKELKWHYHYPQQYNPL